MNPSDPAHFTNHVKQRPSETVYDYCTRVLVTAVERNELKKSWLKQVVEWAYDSGFDTGSASAARHIESEIHAETQPLVAIINEMKRDMSKMITFAEADAAIIRWHREGINRAAKLFEDEGGVPTPSSVAIDDIPDIKPKYTREWG